MQIELKHPIENVDNNKGGVYTVKVLTFRRLQVGDMEVLPDSIFDPNATEEDKKISPKEMIPVICALTDHSAETICKVDMQDFVKVAEGLGAFLASTMSQ